ncbi:MAG: ABC transporter substrate-binding protein [Bacteroidia bacterium]
MRNSPCILLLPLVFLFVISACKSKDKGQENSNELINVQLFTEPQTLHPIMGNLTSSGQNVLAYTNQFLTGYDPATGEPAGWVAEKPPVGSDDFKTMTYTIRKEAAWQDGAAITNSDILFSLKFALCPLSSHPKFVQVMTLRVAGLEAPENEPNKVVLHCKESGIQNSDIMGAVPIIDKRFFDPEGVLDAWPLEKLLAQDPAILEDSALITWGGVVLGGDYQIKPEFLKGVSGPYQVVEWKQKDYIKLSRKPNYWGRDLDGMYHAQGPSQIVFRAMRDPSSIELQVKQGAFDAVTFMPAEVWEKLAADEAVTRSFDLLAGNRTSALAVYMNCRPTGENRCIALADWKVRRAVAHLFSPEAFNQLKYAGKGTPVTTPVPVHSRDYHSGLSVRVKSRDSASYWLDEAGWKDLDGDLKREKIIEGVKVPLKAVLTYIAGNSTEDLAREIMAEANAVGFEMEGERTGDSCGFRKIQRSRQAYDLLITAIQTGHSPYEFSQEWTSNALLGGTNATGYTNPELDSLNALSMATYDLDKRRPLMMQMQEIWFHDQLP